MMIERQSQEKWPAESIADKKHIEELFDEWEKEDRRSPQSVQFDLLFATGWRNGLNACQVARDLKHHEYLWDGFVFDRCDAGSAITLRDIVNDDWNADTLLILPKDHGRAKERGFVFPIYDDNELDLLGELAAGWNPSLLQWVVEEEVRDMLGTTERLKLLRVWWD